MSKRGQCGDSGEKDRQREEIAREIEDFIAKGGRIQVLSDTEHQMARRICSVWHGEEAPVHSLESGRLD